MKELKVIREQEVLGKEFRVYQGENGEFLVLARDVADWIEHSDVSTMVRNIDEDEKVTNIVCTLGGNQKALFITEDGLYEVLMQSRKPIAKEFKKQVKAILKEIRTTGGCVSNEDMFIENYFPFADENTKAMFKQTLLVVKAQNETIKTQEKEIVHKQDVIEGLVEDIDLASKRQRITQIVRYGSNKYSERYTLLYKEFDRKYHCDIKTRLNNAKENGSVKKSVTQMEYICDILGKTDKLYDVCVKVFESDFIKLLQDLNETTERC